LQQRMLSTQTDNSNLLAETALYTLEVSSLGYTLHKHLMCIKNSL
jgi:hypothetical protein